MNEEQNSRSSIYRAKASQYFISPYLCNALKQNSERKNYIMNPIPFPLHFPFYFIFATPPDISFGKIFEPQRWEITSIILRVPAPFIISSLFYFQEYKKSPSSSVFPFF